jgi:hypothetical protein
MRAWGVQGKEAISTLVRNPTRGAWGDPPAVTADGEEHELEYALATGRTSPLEITPLRESLQIQRPMLARLLHGPGTLPRTFSLVSVTSENQRAIVVAAKLGAATAEQAARMQDISIDQATDKDLVFRIYVPAPLPDGRTVNVTLGNTGPRPPRVSRANALEEVIDDANIDVRNGFSIPLKRCLTTYRASYASPFQRFLKVLTRMTGRFW